MYHLSQNELHKEILKPRVPDNNFTRNGSENNIIPRICFSNSIQNCLMALSIGLYNKTFYVYKPNNNINIICNKEIVEKQYVPDALITKEIWSIEETELIAVAKIKVLRPTICHEFKCGDVIDRAYEWEYEILKKY